jgi:hypothetical protein
VEFRAAANSNANVPVASVGVPGSVVAGDVVVLVVSVNKDVSLTVPVGWTLLGTGQDGSPDMRSWVLSRVAPVGFGGSTVSVALSERAKTDLVLLAYEGAAPVSSAVAAVETGSSASHESPAVVVGEGAWVVSYWADKSSGHSGWTLPVGVTERTATSGGSGGGQIMAVVGDSGPLPAGVWPGATAASGTVANKAIAWSIVIPAAAG